MAEQATLVIDGGTTGATTGSATVTTTHALLSEAEPAPQPIHDSTWNNKKEIVDYFKRVQKLEKELKQVQAVKATEAPAAPADRIEQLEATLKQMQSRQALSDAMADAGLTLSAKQRQLIETAYMATKPEDVGAWIRETAEAFGPAKVVPAPTPAVPQARPAVPAPITNTGAPVAAATGVSFRDPRSVPPDVWKRMTSGQRAEIMSAWHADAGVNQTPYRRSK